jgi:hypothetical protein
MSFILTYSSFPVSLVIREYLRSFFVRLGRSEIVQVVVIGIWEVCVIGKTWLIDVNFFVDFLPENGGLPSYFISSSRFPFS